MLDATLTAIEFVRARLADDPTCAAELVLTGTKPPDVRRGILVRVMSGGMNHVVINGRVQACDPTLSVLAFCESEDPGDLRDLSQAMSAALHRSKGTVDSGGVVLNCLQIGPVYFTYRDQAGPTEQWLGANYSVEVKGEN